MLKKKVIVAGHICLDITPVFPMTEVEKIDTILKPGKLLKMQGVSVSTGGCVANTGLAMKMLGADVSLVAKVGNDAFGKLVLQMLKQHDADKGMLIDEHESTSYSVVLAVPGIDRIFLHNPGTNDSFMANDITYEMLDEATLIHFGYPPLMKRMYQQDGEELYKLMKRSKEVGVATSLDLASVDAESDVGKVGWNAILKKILPYVDFFVPSVEELAFMLDRERFEEWQRRANGQDITDILDVERDIKPLADKCMKLGAKVLLIKCGAPGMYYRTADRQILEKVGKKVKINVENWANKEGFEESYVPEAIVSGTGAGDTSIAAFLAAMLEGYSLEEAVQLAAATGASCVSAHDAISGLRSFEALKQKMTQGWKKRSDIDVSKFE